MTAASRPGVAQAAVLLACVCFPVMATALLGPVLPDMERHFAGVPQVQMLIPVMLTTAILAVAVFSPFAGIACDRYSRQRLLLASLALFGLAGVAPAWLDSLHAIIATRVVVGAAEAGIYACSTALIGDYFQGRQRDRYMSLQTIIASLSAFVFNGLGGLLGEMGWRAPFHVNAVAFVMCALVAVFIRDTAHDAALRTTVLESDPPGLTFRPRLLAGLCALAVVGGMVFIMVPVHLAYLLVERGISAPSRIGLAYAANSLGIVAGTLLFGWYIAGRWRVSAQLALCMAVAAAGFLVMGHVQGYAGTTLGSVLEGVGVGILLPMFLTWLLRETPFARRGLALGAFYSCFFLGSFVNPIVLVPMASALGSRGGAIAAWGWPVAGIAALALFWTLRRHPVTTPSFHPT